MMVWWQQYRAVPSAQLREQAQPPSGNHGQKKVSRPLTSLPALMLSSALCTTPPSTSAAPCCSLDSSSACCCTHCPTPLPTSFSKSPWPGTTRSTAHMARCACHQCRTKRACTSTQQQAAGDSPRQNDTRTLNRHSTQWRNPLRNTDGIPRLTRFAAASPLPHYMVVIAQLLLSSALLHPATATLPQLRLLHPCSHCSTCCCAVILPPSA